MERSYSGKEVEAILALVADETDRAISESWDEGFKAGALTFAPETAYLEDINESLLAESERLSEKQIRCVPQWQVPLWVCAGVFFGYGLRIISEKI